MSTPLAKNGHQEAVKLGHYLQATARRPDIVYVSPYVRTWATLTGLLEGWPELSDVTLIEEERIREQEFGLRLLYSDWRFYFALNLEQQLLFDLQGAYWYRYPQGENVADVRDRNRSWMNTLVRDYPGKRILAITHHLNILAFRANMERLNSRQFIELDKRHKPANCSITTYR
jgi:broad specificity phosphatase PhoE